MRKVLVRGADFLDPRKPTVWLALAALVSLFTIAFIARNLPRGFDWSDEAWVYSLIANSRETPGEAWGFQHLLHPLFTGLGESILAFRIVRLVAYVGLAVVTAFGFMRVAKMLGWTLPRGSVALVLLVANVGTLVAFSYPPRYFGYNELTALLVQTGVLAIVLILASAHAAPGTALSRRTLSVLWVLVGFVVCLQVVVKFTSAAVLGVVALAALVVAGSQLSRVQRTVWALAGVVLGAVVLIAAGFPFASYSRNILALIFDEEARTAYDHSASELGLTYALSLADAVTAALLSVTLVILVAVGMRLSGRSGFAWSRAGALVGWTALALLPVALFGMIGSWFGAGWAFPDLGRFSVFLVLAAFGVWAVASYSTTSASTPIARGARVRLILSVVAVAISPLIGALGTNNAIAGQALYAATLWAGALGVALALLWSTLTDASARRAVPAIVALAVICVSAGLVQSDARHPYRTPPFALQNSPYEARYMQGMLGTAVEAEWAAWLTAQGEALDAREETSVAIEAPGAHMVFSNSDFASPWLAAFWPVSFDSLSVACEADGVPERLLVVQVAPGAAYEASVEMFTEALDEGCGLSFPDDFEQVAQHDSQEWQYDTVIWSSTGN